MPAETSKYFLLTTRNPVNFETMTDRLRSVKQAQSVVAADGETIDPIEAARADLEVEYAESRATIGEDLTATVTKFVTWNLA